MTIKDVVVSSPGKILIADRNRHVREFLQREFSREGYQVEMARDGLELWHFLHKEEPPDLLILDLEIPYLDEPALLRHLKERRSPLPVVIHTLFLEEAATAPVSQYASLVEKADNPERLKTVVREMLANRRLAEEPLTHRPRD